MGEGDAYALRDIHSSPETSAYIAGEAPWTKDKAAVKLVKYRDEHSTDGTGKYKILLREDGELIGRAGVSVFDRAAGEYELGYVLKRHFWGRGLATEIASAMAGSFFALNLSDALLAFSDEDNLASHRVLAKIGMRPAGRQSVGGAEALVFQMTRSEWDARR